MTVLWVFLGKSNNNKESISTIRNKKCIDSEINSCVITGIIEPD